ncbi:hypothetical protein [Macrococcus epidermidis]|uniref:hypothetical protein n=1 Tax=Macrococcus epidermidis TaxID=1902580 RepID=UPI0020B84734|nr:hypothetical protein [Macrococcus epidermidis]UTH16698.1 hypothetical protein KFV12_02705 [Macrococcus epidermidis]
MKFGNILIGLFALLFFMAQIFNLYDGITHNDPNRVVNALYLISIGLFMLFNLYNAMLTQSGKVVTTAMVKQQLIAAILLFIFGLIVLIGIFVYDLGILTKIVEFMLILSVFFEIRTRINQLNGKNKQ